MYLGPRLEEIVTCLTGDGAGASLAAFPMDGGGIDLGGFFCKLFSAIYLSTSSFKILLFLPVACIIPGSS